MAQNNIPQLDATKFKFRPLYEPSTNTSTVFDMFVKPEKVEDRPTIVQKVEFINLGKTDFEKNGASFDYYGSGSPYEDEAVELSNGKYLYCIVRGSQFVGTFQSADDIHMRYYEVTPL